MKSNKPRSKVKQGDIKLTKSLSQGNSTRTPRVEAGRTISDEQIAQNEAWVTTLNGLMEIAQYKIQQALEMAKVLSISSEFQSDVKTVRQKWQIIPHLPPKELNGEGLHPQNVLRIWANEAGVSGDRFTEFLVDVQKLFKPFGLDQHDDMGLVAAALCFDLTPRNLIEHWELIWPTAAKEISPGVGLSFHCLIMNRISGYPRS